MPDYAKSKIYKIVDKTNNNIYLGSTILDLNKRLKKHEKDYSHHLIGKMNFISSFEILKNNNYTIEIVEFVPCSSRIELLQKENEYLKKMECVNKNKAYRSIEDIKAQTKKDNDKYKLNNPEKYKEHQEKRKVKVECIICKKCLSKQNMARHIKLHSC